MFYYTFKRLLLTIPTLLVVCGVIFVLLRVIPGDPATTLLSDITAGEAAGSGASNQIERLREEYGLNDPLPYQFADWLSNIIHGNLGVSIATGDPVSSMIAGRMAISLKLAFFSVLLASAVAIPLGLTAAWKQGSTTDFSIVSMSIFLLSIPSFWIGLMLIMFFGSYLNLLPVIGVFSGTPSFTEKLSVLILPITSLVLVEIGIVTRMMRSSTIEVLRLEYITNAKAKGLTSDKILFGHTLKNACAPTLTVIALKLGEILGGVAVIETVFTLPGIGRLLVESIYARDYPVIQGCILIIALIYMGINLIVDLVYPLLDPRVRY